MPDQQNPVIALLGPVDHEGIVSILKTCGYVYEKKFLDSGPKNWNDIQKLIMQDNVEAVLVKLTQAVYLHLLDPDYAAVAERVLEGIVKKKNLVFIYDSLWSFDISDETQLSEHEADELKQDKYGHWYSDIPVRVRMQVKEKLIAAGIEPICYTTNAQLTVIGSQYIQDLAARLLFRVYIPRGRLYSSETDKLLQLFKDFLDTTGRQGVTLNKVAAEQGTSFEFCGRYEDGSSLAEDFQNFSKFFELCVSDINQARHMLSLKDIQGAEASRILTRYAKEARRLFLDLTHDRELKTIEIRHRLESELSEVLPVSTRAELIRSLVDETIPAANITSAPNRVLALAGNPLSLTVNVNSQIIENARGAIIREISGTTNLGANGEELVVLLEKFGGPKASDLISDVQEVSDHGISEGTRISKAQRIKSFLHGLAPEISKVGVHLFEEYLKQKMK